MADHRMIGDILSERRRSLGLSLDRVVADTKLQRRMVEAFEDSDFDAMPPKGYAQASLASYARYLGLNPNEILRVYDDQLYAFERETGLGTHSSTRRRSARRDPEPDELKPSASRSRGRTVQQGQPSRRESARNRDEGYGRGGGYGYGYDDEPGVRSASARRDPYGRNERVRDPYRVRDDAGAYGRTASSGRGRYVAPGRDDPYATGSWRDPYTRGASASQQPRERGLYDSGHRQEEYRGPTRTRGFYEESRPAPRRQEGTPYDARGGREHAAGAPRDWGDPYVPRGSRSADRSRTAPRGTEARREMQTVTFDDGYEGGSGGRFGAEDRYRPRRNPDAARRESIGEVLAGFWHSIRSDRRTFVVIVSAVAITVVVVLVVGISSCVRSNATSDGTDGNIAVTLMSSDDAQDDSQSDEASQTAVDDTALDTSIDLSALAAGSTLEIAVSAEATELPWVEVYSDGTAVYGNTPAAGEVLTFTVSSSMTVSLTSIDGVTISVNGTQVTPTVDNGTYTLSMSVAQAEAESEDGETTTGDEATE